MNKFVIIGGATRSGTTSLFNYLGDHPDICPSVYKETRFYFKDDVESKSREAIFDDYLKLFTCRENHQIMLESSSEYLHDFKVGKRIVQTIGNTNPKLIFILRNPVNRFKSWYRFARQDGKINKALSLHDFFLANLKQKNNDEQHFRVLEQGNYSRYLDSFFDIIGREHIKIIYFEDLVSEANLVLKKVSKFLNIDEEFYTNYDAKVYNKSVEYKYPQLNRLFKIIKRNIRDLLIHKPRLKYFFKKFGTTIDGFYHRFNQKKTKGKGSKKDIDKETLIKIQDYYSEELKKFDNRIY